MADNRLAAGDTARIDMGCEILRWIDAGTVEVRWHNGGFIGIVPLYALTKVRPGPSKTGMPRPQVIYGMQISPDVFKAAAER